MTEFMLDKRIAGVTVHALDLPVSRVLVMDDARYPWLVLVPRRPHLCELHELEPADRIMVIEEIAMAASQLKALTKCHKINVANLGNQVPQLHIHIIARNESDPAWPGPVWGQGAAVPYEPKALEDFVHAVVNMF
jgi:Diadenosine tetraphosphate (Ap4A) hydrolase and other HIT family hydrolases